MPVVKNRWSWNWDQGTKIDDLKSEVEATLPERFSGGANMAQLFGVQDVVVLPGKYRLTVKKVS